MTVRIVQTSDRRARSALPAGIAGLAQDALRDEHFRRLARDIEARAGIKLPQSKKSMVEGRLRRRARALGLDSLDSYGRQLFEGGRLEAEFGHIINCVTTNKTDFFREPDHFDVLCRVVVPRFMSRSARRGDAPIKLWSAASSTGAEAYTLAMVLADLQGRQAFEFSILGTDINTDVIETARRGIYPIDMRDPVPEPMRRAYTMDAIDRNRREFRIVPELRARVKFKPLNLLDQRFEAARDFHVILCRNVLIYFERATQKAVIGRLVEHLRPGGYLVLGHSEATAGGEQPQLRQVGSTVFERKA